MQIGLRVPNRKTRPARQIDAPRNRAAFSARLSATRRRPSKPVLHGHGCSGWCARHANISATRSAAPGFRSLVEAGRLRTIEQSSIAKSGELPARGSAAAPAASLEPGYGIRSPFRMPGASIDQRRARCCDGMIALDRNQILSHPLGVSSASGPTLRWRNSQARASSSRRKPFSRSRTRKK